MARFGTPGERLGFELTAGPKEAPTVVFLHGLATSKSIFDGTVEALRGRYTLLTVDLLGHGDSDAPESAEPYRADAAVTRLAKLLDELGIESAFLCGYAAGGALAVRAALAHPERVAGLILINCSSVLGAGRQNGQFQGRLAFLATRVRAEGTAIVRDSDLFPGQSKRLSEGQRRLLLAEFGRIPPAGLAGTLEGLMPQLAAWDGLRELTLPAAILVGEADRKSRLAAQAFQSRARRSHAVVHTVGGGGPVLPIEQPQVVAGLIAGFITQASTRTLPQPTPRPMVLRRSTAVMGGLAVVAVLAALAAAAIRLPGMLESEETVRSAPLVIESPTRTPAEDPTARETAALGSTTPSAASAERTTPAVSPTPAPAAPLRLQLPDDATPNRGATIGPFCCQGRTVAVQSPSGELLAYVYWYRWLGQAYDMPRDGEREGAVPDILVLFQLPDGTEGLIPFTADELRPGGAKSLDLGAFRFNVAITAAEHTEYNGVLFAWERSLRATLDVAPR